MSMGGPGRLIDRQAHRPQRALAYYLSAGSMTAVISSAAAGFRLSLSYSNAKRADRPNPGGAPSPICSIDTGTRISQPAWQASGRGRSHSPPTFPSASTTTRWLIGSPTSSTSGNGSPVLVETAMPKTPASAFSRPPGGTVRRPAVRRFHRRTRGCCLARQSHSVCQRQAPEAGDSHGRTEQAEVVVDTKRTPAARSQFRLLLRRCWLDAL